MKTLTGVPCNSQGQILHQENGSSFWGGMQWDDWLGKKYSTVVFKSERLRLDSQLCHSTCWEVYEKANEHLWASFSSPVKWGWKQWVTLIESLGGLNEWVQLNYCMWWLNYSMCQLDQAMGYPNICSNVILGISGRVFLHEINMWFRKPRKADCSPWCGGPHPISRRPK